MTPRIERPLFQRSHQAPLYVVNREANPLSSKSQDEELTRAAVELKVLIEQMREQVQNLE